MTTRLYQLQPQLPTAALTHSFDWSDFMALLPTDTLKSAGVDVTGDAGITVSAPTLADDVVYARISGGTAGTTYTVTCSIETDGGEMDSMVAQITIADAS